ncbi:outer membrane beta-barrel protein [Salmonirosea aquatica]|uniref:TonB-dependent receptor n=1 Tax=Salmonirosea aquatica TaxID=2654236 RepID=A0A7C9BS43_9BACT|nr:TonB-dependent receptor [Cytophagaceae bacterium SJW1-29]
MKTRYLLVVLIFLLCFNQVLAQSVPGTDTVSGIVADSASQNPLDLITVQLLNKANTPVNVVYTAADGSFSIGYPEAGNYTLVLSGVGYKNRKIPVNATDDAQRTIRLGTILLSPETVALKEVLVTAAKPIVTQEIDRITYDLQADPESKVYSVLEMMRKVPLLSLDADNTLYMKGNTDFRILVDGKPSSMVERNYKEILRSMPASSIERIEVITSPPAKYDAEGLAGIINIVTRKKLDNGYRGSVNVSERFPVGGPGVGGTVSFKQGKLGMTALFGASIYNTPEVSSWANRTTLSAQPTYLTQTNTTLNKNRSGYLGYEVSYELDSLNLISGQVNLNGSKSSGGAHQNSILRSTSEILQRYDLADDRGGTGDGIDASLNYQRGFKRNKNQLLTFSYRFLKFGNEQNDALQLTNTLNYDLPDYQQTNLQNFSEQTAQIDFVYPVRKLTVEAGVKAILRDNESDFQYRSYNPDKGVFEPRPDFSNQYDNTQNVYGAYNSYQYTFKKWGIKAGARIEQTVMRADFISTQSEAKQHYFNVIPSVSINRKFRKDVGMNLGFSQRIQRPGIYQLNPFVDRSNPLFERTGNPGLRPALVNDFQLGYNKSAKGSVSLGIGATLFQDLIFQVSVLDPASDITRVTYENTGRARLLTGNMNINYPFTKRWNASVNARAAHGKVEGVVNGTRQTNQGLMYSVNVSTGYRFEKEWRITANLNANGPNVNLQGTSNTMVGTSISINKDLVKEKLSIAAAFNNPFTKFRKDHRESFGPNFLQTNDRRDYFRSFHLSLNYKFGKLKEEIKRNKRGIRNDDVQTGG